MKRGTNQVKLGVIFDLDGTLIDSIGDIADATNLALESMAYPSHDLAAFRYFVGDGMRALAERALPQGARQAPEITALTRSIRHHLDRAWHVKTKPYAGIHAMLRALASGPDRLAILSNKPHALTQAARELFFCEIPFDPVLGVSETVPPKPALVGAQQILDQWGLNPEQIVYVGDTKTDMLTASRAGFFAVGVTWGFRPAQELKAHGANVLIDHPHQLLDWVASRKTKK